MSSSRTFLSPLPLTWGLNLLHIHWLIRYCSDIKHYKHYSIAISSNSIIFTTYQNLCINLFQQLELPYPFKKPTSAALPLKSLLDKTGHVLGSLIGFHKSLTPIFLRPCVSLRVNILCVLSTASWAHWTLYNTIKQSWISVDIHLNYGYEHYF